jgi:ribosomal-protein-alanine N-acetyltransferase
VKIRNATPDDINAMMDLATDSGSAARWTAEQYDAIFSEKEKVRRLAIVAVETRQGSAHSADKASMLGFLVARHLTPEWELENIAVATGARRKGIGKELLETLLAAAREANSESVFLEVRDSNQPARALYERAGFRQTGRRKSYYSSPVEDAVLYRFTLG